MHLYEKPPRKTSSEKVLQSEVKFFLQFWIKKNISFQRSLFLSFYIRYTSVYVSLILSYFYLKNEVHTQRQIHVDKLKLRLSRYNLKILFLTTTRALQLQVFIIPCLDSSDEDRSTVTLSTRTLPFRTNPH